MVTLAQRRQAKLGARVVAFFAANLDEELTEADIAVKFSAYPRAVRSKLGYHVGAGMLAHNRNTYRAGPALLQQSGAAK